MNLRRPMMFYFVVAAVLGAVAGLSFSAQSLAGSFPRSPEDVLTQFCELDAKGVRLTDEGWRKAAALFADPEPPSKKHVFVIKDFVVSNPTTKEDKAELYVEYIYVGELDPSSARYSDLWPPLPPNPVKVRQEYSLVRDGRQESANWRITGAQPDVHITVDTAIHYLAKLRDKTASGSIRRNAVESLTLLKRLQ